MIHDAIDQKINHQVCINFINFLIKFHSFLQDQENFAVQKFSPGSKCFDHGSTWEQYVDQCRKKRHITPQAAGCYQVFI